MGNRDYPHNYPQQIKIPIASPAISRYDSRWNADQSAHPTTMSNSTARQQAEKRFFAGRHYHQQGRLDLAYQLYQQAVQLDDSHYAAWHSLGIVASQTQNYSEAVELLGKAICLNPDDAAAYYNLAVALTALKHYPGARECYDKAIELAPGDAEAYNNRGNLLKALAETEAALADYRQAIDLNPDYAEAYNNLGNLLKTQNQTAEALSYYRQAIAIKPDYVEAYFNQGIALAECRQLAAAVQSYEQAIQLKPEFAAAYYNRGLALHAQELYADALSSYQQAIAIDGNCAEYYNNLGNTLKQLKQYSAALAAYQQAIALKPDHARFYNNAGNVLMTLRLFTDALHSYQQALALQPGNPAIYRHIGHVYKETLQLDNALTNYQQAIALQPEDADAHFSLGLCYLQQGLYQPGWTDYEWRLRRENLNQPIPSFKQPAWRGEVSLSGKTILLYSEQGLGDTLQFCRYIQPVAALGANILLLIPAPLCKLLADMPGVCQVLTADDSLPDFDYHCPLPSLPLAFNTRLTSIPAANRYLTADADKVRHWRQQLGPKTRPRIGLVWCGNASFENDQQRSMTLAEFVSLLPDSGFDYICLQKQLKDSDRETLLDYPDIRFFGKQLQDFSDTAALITCLDLVISTCTSVPHLSAALGKPTWILLAANPDWRWLLNRDDSPWYTTVKLFRQTQPGDWRSVLQTVKQQLLLTHKPMELFVISLARTPQRLAMFQHNNPKLMDYHLFPAIDGEQLTPSALLASGLIDGSAHYSNGALGCALSHISLWKQIAQTNTAATICEDDAILQENFTEQAARLLADLDDDWDLILWGWNFDSILIADLLPGLSDCLVFFDQQSLRQHSRHYQQQAVDSKLYRLKRALGIPCYSLSPQGAAKFLKHVIPIRQMEVSVRFPSLDDVMQNFGIDVMMNQLYPHCQSYVAFPPPALSKNERDISTIQP